MRPACDSFGLIAMHELGRYLLDSVVNSVVVGFGVVVVFGGVVTGSGMGSPIKYKE